MADKKPAYPHPEAKPVGGKRNFDKKPERRFGEKKPEGRRFGEKKFGDRGGRFGERKPERRFEKSESGEKRFPQHLSIVNTDIAGGSAFQQAVVSTCAGASPVIYAAMTFFGAVALAASLVSGRITKG